MLRGRSARMLTSLLVLAVGCSDTKLTRATNTDEFQQAPSNMVDILWVIDNSVSMANEQENVALGAEDFMARFAPADASSDNAMDFHLGVISTDMATTNTMAGRLLGTPTYLTNTTASYADQFRARVRVGVNGDDQEKGLQAAVQALSPPLSETYNSGFLREGALLSIIVLSDENDCSDNGALGANTTGEECYTESDRLTPVADLVRELKEIKGDDRVVMSGIVGPEIEAGCADAVPGRRYFTAIDMLGGVRANICETDYSAIMDSLGGLTSGILTIFQLSKNADADTITVTVTPPDGDPAPVANDPDNGWTYISEFAQIEFHGTGIPERGATIEVKYTVASGVVATAPDTGDTASTP
jgi:hypothetical protein